MSAAEPPALTSTNTATKWCSTHQAFLPLEAFAPRARVQKYARCKACLRAKRVEKYHRDIEHSRAESREAGRRFLSKQAPDFLFKRHLKLTYGLTVEAYNAMVRAQGGLCAICVGPPTRTPRGTYRLVVDHRHSTGAVRSLLCGNCNVAIGHMRENPSLLRRAADYLEKHGVEAADAPPR